MNTVPDLVAVRPAAAPPPPTEPARRILLGNSVRLRSNGGRAGIRWGLLASGGAHALIAVAVIAGLLFSHRKLAEPDELPQVEILLGSGADVAGSPISRERPPDPTPPVQAEPPPPPPVPPTTPVPDTVAAPAPAPPAPDVPPAPPPPAAATPPMPVANTAPLPPPSPPQPQPAPSAEPPPAAAPPPPPPPPPKAREAKIVPPPAPEAPPEVRLGEGIVGSLGEITDAGKVARRAEADTGNRLPVYPLDAARRHQHGRVVVRLSIDIDGHVTRVEVAKSSGFPSLDQAALDRLISWHFKPAMRDGLPQADVLEMGVEFQLD